VFVETVSVVRKEIRTCRSTRRRTAPKLLPMALAPMPAGVARGHLLLLSAPQLVQGWHRLGPDSRIPEHAGRLALSSSLRCGCVTTT